MTRLSLAWLFPLVLIAAPVDARAQPGKSAAAAEASGRAHFQRGQRLSARGDYAGAYREFSAGYDVTHRPLFLFNMAEAARANGDADKAREAYHEFLRVDPNNALAATAQARLTELEPQPPPSEPIAPPAQPALPLLPPAMAPPVAHGDGVALPAGPGERDEARPLWKRWPFWAVVAGGVVAGGAIVFVVRRDGGPCGADCSQFNFR
jgi:tetratricopeptide (TPR) repeat protein